MSSSRRRLPLADVRVIDLTRFISGPYCTLLLADQGAEVVKVEPPGGEPTRHLAPLLGDRPEDHVSAYWLRYNRSKQSVCLDTKTERGRAVLERLLARADVLVENFRPGVLERMGLGWPRLRELNTRLIYCSISGFGHSASPLRDRGAFTPIVEATSGALTYAAEDASPRLAGYPVGDLFPAALSAAAIGMALFRREHDGLGAHLDMAMFDGMMAMNERALGMSAMIGRDFLPGLPSDVGSSPAGIYRARDGFISIAVVGEDIWQRLCRALGRDDWATDNRLASGVKRGALHDDVLLPGLEDWLSKRSCPESVRILNQAGVPAAQAANPRQVIDSEQARARDMVVRFPTFGQVTATAVGSPIRFTDEGRSTPGAAPAVGEHTRAILSSWAALDNDEIEDLLRAGVAVQYSPRTSD